MTALATLRARLAFEVGTVAQVLGIAAADVEAIEATPLRLLDLATVERFVGALGCRLDVVAVHIDGEAIWLNDDEQLQRAATQPHCARCGMALARFSGPGAQSGWVCVQCEGRP